MDSPVLFWFVIFVRFLLILPFLLGVGMELGSYKRGVSLFVLHMKKCMGIMKRLSIVGFHRVTTLLRLKINVKLQFRGFCADYIMCSNTCSNSQCKTHKITRNGHFEPQKRYPEYASTDVIFPLQYSHTSDRALVCPSHGVFTSLFSKSHNSQGSARRRGQGTAEID